MGLPAAYGIQCVQNLGANGSEREDSTEGDPRISNSHRHSFANAVDRMLNGRALTANSDDPKDLQPLTPAHFLMQRHTICLPPDNSPRGCRNLGWVLEPYAGPDGLVRVVKVKTKDAVYMRPTQKLCLLENDMN